MLGMRMLRSNSDHVGISTIRGSFVGRPVMQRNPIAVPGP